jgi:hypothetical protein
MAAICAARKVSRVCTATRLAASAKSAPEEAYRIAREELTIVKALLASLPLASTAQLDDWFQRALDAASLAEVFDLH